MVHVQASPFGVAVSPDGRWAFAGSDTTMDVLSLRSGLPRVVHEVQTRKLLQGLAITPDGRYLLDAHLLGVVVIATGGLERGQSKVLGTLSSAGVGALEVAVSKDGRYAFAPLEGSAELAVFDLQRALTHGFGRSDLVGFVPLQQAPVGIAVSPDGRYLYATSESADGSRDGTLTTIDLSRAETDPASTVVSTVPAGCTPVRVVASRTNVYVTARGSDALLQFSAQRLVSSPGKALEATLRVGEEPVGLALVAGGRGIVVADSNRFEARGASSNLALVRLGHGGAPILAGYVRSGVFPRDVAAAPDGRTAYVANFGSGQVEAVDVPPVLGR